MHKTCLFYVLMIRLGGFILSKYIQNNTLETLHEKKVNYRLETNTKHKKT